MGEKMNIVSNYTVAQKHFRRNTILSTTKLQRLVLMYSNMISQLDSDCGMQWNSKLQRSSSITGPQDHLAVGSLWLLPGPRDCTCRVPY